MQITFCHRLPFVQSTKKAPSLRELAGDNRKKVPVVSVSADQRKAANRTYHGCKVCLKTKAEGALFSATNYCGRQAKDKKPREGRPNVFYLKVQPCFFAEKEEESEGSNARKG